MPCRCDYMDPTLRELESIKVAKLLIYVLPLVDQPISDAIRDAANNSYGDIARVDKFTYQLCEILENLPNDELETIVYDAHNPVSRELASWWEKHQEHDRIRELKITEKEKQTLHKQLVAKFEKLTIEQMKQVILSAELKETLRPP